MTNTEEDLPTLPELPGIDVVVGLEHAGGKVPLYYKVPRNFRDKHGLPFAENFQQKMESGDIAGAARLAHSIKGMALMLGAQELGERALALEHAAKATDLTQIESSLPKVINELTKVLGGLGEIK